VVAHVHKIMQVGVHHPGVELSVGKLLKNSTHQRFIERINQPTSGQICNAYDNSLHL